MAYTLKSSGIATNLIHCLVVDSGVLVDKKAVATISDVTGCTFGTAQWRSATSNSSSHEYVQTNGTTGKVTFGTKPTFSMGGTRSIFIAFQGAGTNLVTGAGTAGYFCGGSGAGIGWSSWNPIQATFNSTAAAIPLTKAGADIYNKTTAQMALAFCMNGATSAAGYYDEDGGAMTDVSGSPTLNATPQTYQPTYWGCFDTNATPITHKLYCVAQFDKNLSAAEVQSLNEDWFGTLFTSGASAVKPLGMLLGIGK